MSSFEVPNTNSTSKCTDQPNHDAVRSIIISPLPLLDLPTRPKSSQKIISDVEKMKHAKIGPQEPIQLDSSMNISNSNPSIIVDKSSEAMKKIFDVSNDPSHKMDDLSAIERPPFSSFFTLIKTGETIAYPKQVHYLFSDDDTSEVLTSTILRSLFEEDYSNLSPVDSVGSKDKLEKAISTKSLRDVTPTKLHRNSKLKNIDQEFTDKGIDFKSEKRVLIVDLNPDGDGVASINSLSAKWQVLNAQIEKAPTWNGADDTKAEKTSNIVGNMMLNIEGIDSIDLSTHTISSIETEGTRPGVGSMKGVGNLGEIKKAPGEEEMRNILENFDLKMDILRRVIGTRQRLDSQDTVVEKNG